MNITLVMFLSLVSPYQPWPPSSRASAAGANVSSVPANTVRAIMNRARRMAVEAYPIAAVTFTRPRADELGLRRPAPPAAPRRRPPRAAPGCTRRPGSVTSRWSIGASNTVAPIAAASSRWLRGGDAPVAGGDHGCRRHVDRVQPRPRVEAPELPPGLGDVAGRVARQLGQPPGRLAARPGCRPGGSPARQVARGATESAAPSAPIQRQTLTVSGSWKCWAVPLSTIPRDHVAVVAGDQLGDRARPSSSRRRSPGRAPSARTTAAASAAQSTRRNGSIGRRPRPWPRWSIASTR